MSEAGRKHPPPWLFGILGMPNGLGNAIIVILMPYLLRQRGVPVDRIAETIAIASIPQIWYFLYSPLVDMGWRRRSWILLGACGAGVFAALAILLIPASLAAATALLFLASASGSLISSANGALLTFLPPAVRGRTGGFYQGGNLGGGALGGGLVIWLADRVSLPALALAAMVIVVLPACAAFWIEEAPAAKRALLPLFADLFGDLKDVLRSRRVWLGLVFFLSPVGSSAVANLISGLGPDYRAPASEVMWVSGIAGGLLNVAGSLLGGYICDRMNRMAAYAFAGLWAAVCAFYMAFGPHSPWTYGIAYSGYALAAGFAYAVFCALELDVLGPRRHAAGTAYALLGASGNVPILYMTWLDGAAYKHGAVTGLMTADGLANGVFALLLFGVAGYARRYWQQHEKVDAESQ